MTDRETQFMRALMPFILLAVIGFALMLTLPQGRQHLFGPLEHAVSQIQKGY